MVFVWFCGITPMALLPGCSDEEAVGLSAYNADDDAMSVMIGPELLPAQTLQLRSTTGQVVIGEATFDPGGGPVGTTHLLRVRVDSPYDTQVDAASALLSSPGRGERELDLEVDSADEGLYQVALISYGEADEVRTDTLTVRLWDDEDDEEPELTE